MWLLFVNSTFMQSVLDKIINIESYISCPFNLIFYPVHTRQENAKIMFFHDTICLISRSEYITFTCPIAQTWVQFYLRTYAKLELHKKVKLEYNIISLNYF